MDSLDIPVKFNKALLAFDYEQLKKVDKKKCLRANLLGLIGCIPYLGSAITEGIASVISYRDAALFRKMFVFLYDLKETTPEEREKFANEIEKSANDSAGNVVCDMIERLDNINKADILANFVRARINGEIDIAQFFRLSAAIERIPYPDFNFLKRFEEEDYIEGGVTETLYASGALILATIDADGNTYTLSALGQKILKYGLLYDDVRVDAKNATSIPTIGMEDIDKIIDSKNDDKAMFDLDVNRGK